MTRRAFGTAAAVLFSAAAEAQIPLGPEFRVDTQGALQFPSFFDYRCDAALAADGRLAVTWTARPQSTVRDQVVRRFDPRGRAIGLEFAVNSYTTGEQGDGSIAMDDAGNFVVAWTSHGQGGSGTRIYGQRFSASGARLGREFPIANTPSQRGASVAMRRDGGFVVAWREPHIMARLFDSSGAPIGAEFQANTTTGVISPSPSVDVDDAGNFVVVWQTGNGPFTVHGQRFSATGAPLGGEFMVSDGVFPAHEPKVAMSGDGSFVVAWYGAGASAPGVHAWLRRYDAAGAPIGSEFAADSATATFSLRDPDIDLDADGDIVVTWGDDGDAIFARRLDAAGTPTGPEFRVDAATTGYQTFPKVAVDRAGNFVVAWHSRVAGYDTNKVLARRYAGGLMAAALSVDASAGPTSDGNGVLEAGETVTVAPSWLNANATAQAFTGRASAFTGPGTGAVYTIADATADYGTVVSGGIAGCAADCYALGISNVGPAPPVLHWDASFREDIAPASLGARKDWTLHVGDTFADVPRSHVFYRFIETMVHNGVTVGCRGGETASYCPDGLLTRAQAAPLVLVAKEGAGYVPPACTEPPLFPDVPASSPFCPWVEELARRGAVGGCGALGYCPNRAISRQELAVVLVKTLDPLVAPPACVPPNIYPDVPETSPYCPWIEELARRGMVADCGGGNYCPAERVTRGAMAEFVTRTFGLSLYGP